MRRCAATYVDLGVELQLLVGGLPAQGLAVVGQVVDACGEVTALLDELVDAGAEVIARLYNLVALLLQGVHLGVQR